MVLYVGTIHLDPARGALLNILLTSEVSEAPVLRYDDLLLPREFILYT